MELHVATSGKDSDFVVKLIDVYPGDFPQPSPPPRPLPRRPPMQRFVDIAKARAEDFQKATQRVYRSAERPSSLGLWVLSEARPAAAPTAR